MKIALFSPHKNTHFAVSADRSVQPVIVGNCHFLLQFLSAEITMFHLVSCVPTSAAFLSSYQHNYTQHTHHFLEYVQN